MCGMQVKTNMPAMVDPRFYEVYGLEREEEEGGGLVWYIREERGEKKLTFPMGISH